MKRTLSQILAITCAVISLCICSSALDRNAFTFVSYDLQVRVTPNAHRLATAGRVVVRNDSAASQKSISLQISSSLEWKSIRADGKDVTYITQPYQSDVDHTGAVSEAVITLPNAVAPKQTVELDLSYAGEIVSDSTRLTRIGTPEKVALENDWDRISADFTAVRGVGYVCWYPVSMDPANLSEGNRYFDVIGEWKRRNANASMKLTLTVEGDTGQITNGRILSTTAHASVTPGEPVTRENVYAFVPVGTDVPTFVVGDFSSLERPSVTVAYLPDHRAAAEEFATAAEATADLLKDWFGPIREKARVIELLDPNAQPFDAGVMVFTPLRTSDTRRVEVQMAHQVAHASLPPGISEPWIREGLAQFAQALVREKQAGRRAALAWMNAFIPALVSAEKQSVGTQATGAQAASQKDATAKAESSASQTSLLHADDPAFSSIKAMFVWWMLRDMVGDEALGRAIRAYDPSKTQESSTMEKLIQAHSKRDLQPFFNDWVYNDLGLPDLRIDSAFPRSLEGLSGAGGAFVTVTVENLGEPGAEVPIVVHTPKGDVTSRILVKGKAKAVQRIQLPVEPATVTVNDGSVPEANVANNTFTFKKSP